MDYEEAERWIVDLIRLLRQHVDPDSLVDPAEEFEDHQPRIVDEFLMAGHQEEVVLEDGGAQLQLLLGLAEVEIGVEASQEFRDGVAVAVALLLQHLHQVPEREVPPLLVNNNSSSQVAQDVRADGLDGVQVLVLVQEHLHDQLPPFSVVEEDKQGPVDEPRPGLEGLQWTACLYAGIQDLFQSVEVIQGIVPLLNQNLGGQFPPQRAQVVLVGRRHQVAE